ncbi:MAG TPA: SMC family ATPase, partial [Thermoplasmata archaeon]|nr:SMC family ATPase [Thermoplasmata archaeon]
LVGDVGAGKTSLLYAIEMALFGFAEVDPVHLIRHRSKDAEVVLGLSDGAHAYELRRRFSRKSRKGKEVFEAEECAFGQDGAVQQYSTTELRQRAIDLLGFPDNPNARAHSDLWRWAVYIPQERMRDVLVQEPTERRETVRKALGLEQFKTAADNALLLAREISARGRSLEDRADMLTHCEDDLGRATAERDRTDLRLGELRAAADTAAGERAAADGRLAVAESAARAAALDRAALQRTRDELADLARRRQALDQQRAEADRRRREQAEEAERLDREVAHRPKVEADLRATRSDVDRLSAEEARLDGLQRERASAESSRDSATQALQRAVDERRRAEAELERSQERWQAARSLAPTEEPTGAGRRTLPEIDAARARAQADLEAAQTEFAERRPQLADLESLLASGNCPRCHQRVDPGSFGPHRDEARAALAAAELRVRTARAASSALEEERRVRETFERDLAAWRRAEEVRRESDRQRSESIERADRARSAVAAAELHRAEVERHLASLPAMPVAAGPMGTLRTAREQLASLERLLETLARAEERRTALHQRAGELAAEAQGREREAESLLGAMAAAESRRVDLEGRLGATDPDRLLEEARLSARAAQERTEALGREIARRETERTGWSERIREAEAGRTRRRQLLAEAESERGLATFLQGPFRETLTQLEERLLERAQREFERTFARAFQTLVEDPTIAARTDGAFTPAVEIDGEWTPAEALSGGERTALALAFRIALGQVIRGAGRLRLETLILDEPTDGFSPEQVVRVGELLRDLGLPQVILVSHESGLAAVADHVIRVAKLDGVSVVRSEGAEAPPTSPPSEPRPEAALPAR